ncbi:multidrug/biocide efflux PACE transporter [Ralstonia syzygii]|uniref:Transmembrane pair, permease of the major facilitator superfamily n=1 Tax=Ralstonia syzygii R24 TaxID=907261 RepID=G3ABZ2_9RALS|nr:multidrug/biocide efflux PACE transporter [Ralstonia syzygii]CCA87065.1 transmembrane pair, permease of the major facilitator superfamily [Ralstonia syzygii R24]
MSVPQKPPLERVCHALAFELIATLICAPLLSWLMALPLTQMGALTILFALVAMAWNMVFNAGFERIERRCGWARTLTVRAAHAVAFEGGLVVLLVPLGAWWLGVSLLEAPMLDIGIMLFFLPYTFFFNLAYDRLRARWAAGRAVA